MLLAVISVVVQARRVLCFLVVRELGLTTTELAQKMELSQPAISISVNRDSERIPRGLPRGGFKRGEGIVKERNFELTDFLP